MQPTLTAHFSIVTERFPHEFNKRLQSWPKLGFTGEYSRGRIHFLRESPPRRGAPHLIEGDLDGGFLSGSIVLFGERQDWTSLIEAFREESEALLKEIHAAIDPLCPEADRQIDPPVADPSLEGAELAAPDSLLASPSRDQVTFTLPGPWRSRSDRTKSLVSVTSGGIVLSGDWHRGSLGWDKLGGVTLAVQGDTTHLRIWDPEHHTVALLGCSGSPDDDWLAQYLDAQIARRRPPAEDREREAQQRAAAVALLGEAKREK